MLPAQPVQFGVKGGVVLTDQTIHPGDASKLYTVGPTAEIRLPRNFALETGFLYKRTGTGNSYRFGDNTYNITSRGNSFEIPVVGKYYFPRLALVRPYLGLGVAMRRSNVSTDTVITGPATNFVSPGTSHVERLSPWGAGAVGAAGVQVNAGRLKISPEVRYTRWSQESQAISRNSNQAELLLGISF